jgi:hypothetical protein
MPKGKFGYPFSGRRFLFGESGAQPWNASFFLFESVFIRVHPWLNLLVLNQPCPTGAQAVFYLRPHGK